MRAYFSTQPLYNLLFPHINSRFAVHLAAISEPYGAPSDDRRHPNSSSSISQASGCHLFHNSLACPPPAWKDDLPPKERRPGSLQLHQSIVTRKAGA